MAAGDSYPALDELGKVIRSRNYPGIRASATHRLAHPNGVDCSIPGFEAGLRRLSTAYCIADVANAWLDGLQHGGWVDDADRVATHTMLMPSIRKARRRRPFFCVFDPETLTWGPETF